MLCVCGFSPSWCCFFRNKKIATVSASGRLKSARCPIAEAGKQHVDTSLSLSLSLYHQEGVDPVQLSLSLEVSTHPQHSSLWKCSRHMCPGMRSWGSDWAPLSLLWSVWTGNKLACFSSCARDWFQGMVRVAPVVLGRGFIPTATQCQKKVKSSFSVLTSTGAKLFSTS